MGVGMARENKSLLESVAGDLATITGQKPKMTRAKKSIANFKLREGMPVGEDVVGSPGCSRPSWGSTARPTSRWSAIPGASP